jgi:hypothetical protein
LPELAQRANVFTNGISVAGNSSTAEWNYLQSSGSMDPGVNIFPTAVNAFPTNGPFATLPTGETFDFCYVHS